VRDIYFSGLMAVMFFGLIAAYALRALLSGRLRNARAEADGGSVLLGKPAIEMVYWFLNPIVSFLAAAGVTPNMITLFSLIPATAAAVALSYGWFGLACFLATAGSLCDTVDGPLARKLGVSSDAGEIVDATADRYVEFLFFGGLAMYYRSHWIVLVLVLGAIFGAFMVSYATAKAEAMGVEPPRGAMRRAERCLYLLIGTGLTAFSKEIFASSPSHALRELPIILAVTMVAVVANVSTVQRMIAVAAALRAREAAAPNQAGRSAPAGPAAAATGDPEESIITKQDNPVGLV
jgi:CDP-diacylglycerol--glycerol-3-phosphate 3-phosphatidyltransferase